MFLSRIELCTYKPNTRRAMASPQVLHAAIEGCFVTMPGVEKGRKLWRIDSLNQRLYLLLLSPACPDFTEFAAQFCTQGTNGETKDYNILLNRIKTGQNFRFRFRGNPVRSVSTEEGKRGKVYAHVTVTQKREWLIKKAGSCGFLLQDDSFDLVETGQHKFWRDSKKQPVELAFSVFEGMLTVTDAALFTQALTQGIGRGKAYGCGLLTVMSVV